MKLDRNTVTRSLYSARTQSFSHLSLPQIEVILLPIKPDLSWSHIRMCQLVWKGWRCICRSRISVLKTLREARLHLPSPAGGLCGWSRMHSVILYSTLQKNTSTHQLMNLHKGRICHSKQQDEFYFSKQTLIFYMLCISPFICICLHKHKDILYLYSGKCKHFSGSTFPPQNKIFLAMHMSNYSSYFESLHLKMWTFQTFSDNLEI